MPINDPSPNWQSLAVAALWNHYRTEEREGLALDAMQRQVRFVEECLREARQVIEAHLTLWESSRPSDFAAIPRERELYLALWSAAASGRVDLAR